MIKELLRNYKVNKISMFVSRTALIIVIVVLISYVLFVSLGFIHEYGHIYEASNQNITFTFNKINLLPSLTNWGKADVITETNKDCQLFNALPIESRKKITFAGVKWSVFYFGMPVFLVLLIILLVFNQKDVKSKHDFSYELVLVLFFVFIAMLIYLYYTNILSSYPYNDGHLISLPCKI